MKSEGELDQDPGIPGPKVPVELPPEDEPEVDPQPDVGPAEVDDEGHQAPPRKE